MTKDDHRFTINDDQRVQYWVNKENSIKPTDTINMKINNAKKKVIIKDFSVSSGYDIFNIKQEESQSRSASPQRSSMVNHYSSDRDPLVQSMSVKSKSRMDMYSNTSNKRSTLALNRQMMCSSHTKSESKNFGKVNGISDTINRANSFNSNFNKDFQTNFSNNPNIFRKAKGM